MTNSITPSMTRIVALMVVTASSCFRGSGNVSYAQELKLAGTVETLTYPVSEGQELARRVVDFQLWSKDCLWFIRLTEPTTEFSDYVEAAYDGRYIYYLKNFKTALEARRLKGEETGENVATGAIGEGQVLRSIFAEEAGPLWLALGSGCYFRKTQDDKIESVLSSPTDSVMARRFQLQKAFYALQNSYPYLPTRVSYLDGSFTNAVYSVSEYTNCGTATFPRYCEMNVYTPQQTRAADKSSFLDKKYRIIVRQVSTNCERQNFAPSIPGVVLVTDFRPFGNSSRVVTYPVRADTWPSETQIMTISASTNILAGNTQATFSATRATGFVRFLVLLVFLGSAFAFVVLLRQKTPINREN